MSAEYKQELLQKIGNVAVMNMTSTSSKEVRVDLGKKKFLQVWWYKECSQVEVALLVAFVSENKEDPSTIKVSYAAGKATINYVSKEQIARAN